MHGPIQIARSGLIEQGRTILDAGCGDRVPVDRYLVGRGYAVNGVDVSAQLIDLARKNVPDGFYEVKDVLQFREGEYCVDGIVPLRALLHLQREESQRLLRLFASFMPNGGAILLTMGLSEGQRAVPNCNDMSTSRDRRLVDSNTELLESAGFRIIQSGYEWSGTEKHQMILARS